MLLTRLRRLPLIAALAAAGTLAAAACSSSASAPAASSGRGPELTHITVGALAITDDAPLFSPSRRATSGSRASP